MKPTSIIFSKCKIANLFLLFGVIYFTNKATASNNSVSLDSVSLNYTAEDLNEWTLLFNQKDVFIYYSEIKEIPCKGYKLKIKNLSKENVEISFGVAGNLNKECKSLYSDYHGFQSRKISLKSGETIIGSEKTTSLLIPNSNNNIPLEDLMQNLIIQNIAK